MKRRIWTHPDENGARLFRGLFVGPAATHMYTRSSLNVCSNEEESA